MLKGQLPCYKRYNKSRTNFKLLILYIYIILLPNSYVGEITFWIQQQKCRIKLHLQPGFSAITSTWSQHFPYCSNFHILSTWVTGRLFFSSLSPPSFPFPCPLSTHTCPTCLTLISSAPHLSTIQTCGSLPGTNCMHIIRFFFSASLLLSLSLFTSVQVVLY